MSLNAVTGAPLNVGRPQETRTPRADRPLVGTPSAPATPAMPSVRTPPAPATTAPGAVAAPPPPGTDPELWQVLTAEERSFFARAYASGPLTYGRAALTGQADSPAAFRGTRLDVRV